MKKIFLLIIIIFIAYNFFGSEKEEPVANENPFADDYSIANDFSITIDYSLANNYSFALNKQGLIQNDKDLFNHANAHRGIAATKLIFFCILFFY